MSLRPGSSNLHEASADELGLTAEREQRAFNPQDAGSSAPAPVSVVSAAAHMLLDKQDQVAAQLRRAKDVVAAFLRDLDEKGIDLLKVKVPHVGMLTGFASVDPELLIQLRDIARRP